MSDDSTIGFDLRSNPEKEIDTQQRLEIIEPIFFDPNNPDRFWNEERMFLLSKQSTRGYPSYPFIDAAKIIIDENIASWIAGMDDDARIEFFLSEEFFLFIEETVKYDFNGKFSHYIQDVDKGWIIKHIATFLTETYFIIPNEDPRKLQMVQKVQHAARLIIRLWSFQYKHIASIALDWYMITDEKADLDIKKASELITKIFKEKTSIMVRGLFSSGRREQ